MRGGLKMLYKKNSDSLIIRDLNGRVLSVIEEKESPFLRL